MKNKPNQTQFMVSKVEPLVVSKVEPPVVSLSNPPVVRSSNLLQTLAEPPKQRMVGHSFCKTAVLGSNPTIGCVNLQRKYNSLQKALKKLRRVIVAYSGGVDSTFLLKVAVDTLGPENVLACIAKGPSLPAAQYRKALSIAKKIGVAIQAIEQTEFDDQRYLANKADRCFYCKSHLFEILTSIAKEKKFNYVICGHNFDDLKDYRPGNKAAEKYSIRSPLMEAKLTKNDIRQLSRQLGLPTADIPASPCLASRIIYGLQITQQRLNQIEKAEEFLKKFGLIEFRVRHHDQIARIEVHPQDFEKIATEPARSKIIKKLKSLGFKYITIDLQGFRSGSLNELLTKNEKRNVGNKKP
jgi:uncharacterized protein